MTRFRKMQFKAKQNGFVVEKSDAHYRDGYYEVYKTNNGEPIHNSVVFCRNLTEVEETITA